jgi:hypothetical protein
MEPFEKKVDIEANDIQKSINKNIAKPSKPVKFTWEGLRNFGLLFETNPFSKLKTDRLRQLMSGQEKGEEKDYIDFFEDMEKSVYGAAQSLGYSFGDLITTGIDAAADTELTKKLDEVYEQNKIESPETLLGSVNKVLIEYGVPGGGVFKAMNRAKKILRKGKKAKQAAAATGASSNVANVAKRVGYMATAFGATDFIVANPERENLVLKKEKEEGLSGRDLALARFRNRVRFGAEGATVGAGFALMGKPLAKIATVGAKYGLFKPVGLALQGVDLLAVRPATYLIANIPGSKAAGRLVRNTSSYVVDKTLSTAITLNPKKQLPDFDQWRMFSIKSSDPLEKRLKKIDNFLSNFRSLGKQTGLGFQFTSGAKREIKARSRTIDKYLQSIEKKSYDLAKSFEGYYNTATTSPASKEYYLDQVLAYLKGQLKLPQLPKQLQETAKNLNNELIDTKKTFGELLPKGDLKNFILNNLKTYMRKSFSVFTNPEYMPDQKVRDGAVKYILENVVKRNKDMKESAKLLKTGKMTDAQAQEAYADSLVHKILTNTKQDGRDPLQLLKDISKSQLRSDKLIRTGEELPDAIKKLLGEENNLKASVLQTTSHAISQSVNKQTYDELAKIGLREGWLFADEGAANAARNFDAIKIGEIKGLGILKSNISKLYASKDMHAALKGVPGRFDGLLQSSAYRNILQFKVATQFGKTVLSPATQVRNVTSASMFPLANGHIGGRASVTESIKMVMDDIFGAGKLIDEKKFIDNLENKIRLGVIDENIVASELQAVLKEIKAGAKVKNLDSLLARLAETRMIKTATRVYAGGDNLWKWYGHEYVKSQMKSMYKNVDDIAKWTEEITGRKFVPTNTFTGVKKTFDEAVDEAAAWQIRNTYPTYSKVPQIVQDIRKLPFGNFVSFPAEMIRTTYNILSIGAKEATSSNAQLRQNGYRRLLGALVTLGGAQQGVSTIAQNLTGVTMEQVDAYKRSLAAPWDSRAAILPINKWKDGVGKAINFSYFSPYDVVTQPATALLKTIEEKNLKQQDVDQFVFNLMLGPDGPVRKLIDPFVSESIALEKTFDVIPAGTLVAGRGGVTKTGARVYSETDDGPTAFLKSLVHIFKGVRPTAIDTTEKIVKGIEGDVKRGGQPVTLQDELLALLSGIRIINVDVPRTMQYKITEYNRNFRSVTTAEKFFSLENFDRRGPLVIADEFRDIQDETLRVNRDFYFILKDALEVGVPEKTLKKIVRERGISFRNFKKLIKGENIPYTAYKERMKKRVKEAEKLDRGKVNKEYFYPKRLLKQIEKEYKNKKLETQETETETEPTSSIPTLDDTIQTTSLPRIQTPPLPNTPMPNQRLVANVPQNNLITGLTRTQQALLSPEEQVIARKT